MVSEPDAMGLGVWGRPQTSRMGHTRSRSETMLFPNTPWPMFEGEGGVAEDGILFGRGTGSSGGSLLRELPFCADEDDDDDDGFSSAMEASVVGVARDFGDAPLLPELADAGGGAVHGTGGLLLRSHRHMAHAPEPPTTHPHGAAAAAAHHLPPLQHTADRSFKGPHSDLFVQATAKPIRQRHRAIAAVADARAAAADPSAAPAAGAKAVAAAADAAGHLTDDDDGSSRLLKEAAPRGQHYPRDPSVVLDAKKAKRILANRKSAQKSRQKKLQFIDELELELQKTKADRDAVQARLKEAEGRALAAEHEADVLRKQLDDLLGGQPHSSRVEHIDPLHRDDGDHLNGNDDGASYPLGEADFDAASDPALLPDLLF